MGDAPGTGHRQDHRYAPPMPFLRQPPGGQPSMAGLIPPTRRRKTAESLVAVVSAPGPYPSETAPTRRRWRHRPKKRSSRSLPGERGGPDREGEPSRGAARLAYRRTRRPQSCNPLRPAGSWRFANLRDVGEEILPTKPRRPSSSVCPLQSFRRALSTGCAARLAPESDRTDTPCGTGFESGVYQFHHSGTLKG